MIGWFEFGVLTPTATADDDGASKQAARLEPSIARLVEPLIDNELTVGIVVGTVDSQGTHVFPYGRVSKDKDQKPDGETLFEIGSLTKVFTSLLLADMVTRNVVGLDDPVRGLLPAEAVAPVESGRSEITLLDLATHRSGLPRDPSMAKDLLELYATFDENKLYAFLKTRGLTKANKKVAYNYSNVGAGLLGHALALRAGKSYEVLLDDVVTGPLGMKSTCLSPGEDLRSRLAQGYDPFGEPRPPAKLAVLAPCGAMRSTTNDMLRFLRAEMDLDETPLADAMTLSQERCAKFGKKGEGIALAWHIAAGGKKLWHSGDSGSFHSFVAFDTEQKIGVVFLSNLGQARIDELGWKVLGLLAGESPEPMTITPIAKVDSAIFLAYAGHYEVSPGIHLVVKKDGDKLFIQLTGQSQLRVYPSSETTFFCRVVKAEVTFEKDPDGKVTQLILHQNGHDTRCRRVEPNK